MNLETASLRPLRQMKNQRLGEGLLRFAKTQTIGYISAALLRNPGTKLVPPKANDKP
jgi:hypothetical protein